MTKIAVVGYKGKMGSVVCELLSGEFEIVGIEKDDSLNHANQADIVIDFGGAESSAKSANWCKEHKKKLIVGSTGQTKEQLNAIFDAAKEVPVLVASNFSFGIFKIKQFIKLMSAKTIEQVIIFETHHKFKRDKPSGTALELKNAIQRQMGLEPEIICVRAGEEVGEHKIVFYFSGEKLEISHQAFSRTCFAEGVKKAVQFMLGAKERKLYLLDEIFV